MPLQKKPLRKKGSHLPLGGRRRSGGAAAEGEEGGGERDVHVSRRRRRRRRLHCHRRHYVWQPASCVILRVSPKCIIFFSLLRILILNCGSDTHDSTRFHVYTHVNQGPFKTSSIHMKINFRSSCYVFNDRSKLSQKRLSYNSRIGKKPTATSSKGLLALD